jgi:hypothetical protein
MAKMEPGSYNCIRESLYSREPFETVRTKAILQNLYNRIPPTEKLAFETIL